MTPGSVQPPTFRDVLAALERRTPSRMVPDLARIRAVTELMGQPQRAYPSVHVTGTNGKTSTTRMVDALLRGLGLRTGRFTSPHLESVTERIAVDGQPLSEQAFAAAYADVEPFVDVVDGRQDPQTGDRVTFHELLTAMAFAAFADAPVDAAVVEVGMGGSWDATNVIDAPVAVVTPIGLDHVQWLGPTVADIAREKAGIVHPGATLVSARQDPAAAEVLAARVAEVGASAVLAGVDFGVVERRLAVGGQELRLRGLTGEYDGVFLPLLGGHQAANAATALAAVEAFLGGPGGRRGLDPDVVGQAFAEVASPGRLEVVRRGPAVLLDVAHNPAGAEALATALTEDFAFSRLVAVVGVLDDKDVVGILAALEPVVDAVVLTQSSSERALPAVGLAEAAEDVFDPARILVVPALPAALDAAIELAEADGNLAGAGVLVTGSVTTVGEARRLLRGG